MTSLKAVLFDWDGTLADSAEATYRCYVRVFARYGIAFDRAAFERTYAPDWYRTYAAVGLEESHWAEADALWLEAFRREPTTLLPGAEEALRHLEGAGMALGVVTSGSRERVTRDIAGLGLSSRFRTLTCAEDAANRKPHPEPLLRSLEMISLAPGEAAYVGDSPEDVAMARAAGAFSVGIPGGFPNREALVASRPDLLASSLGHAAQALTRPPGATRGLA